MDQGEWVACGLDAGRRSAVEDITGCRKQLRQTLGLEEERDNAEDDQRGDHDAEGTGSELLADGLEVYALEHPHQGTQRDCERRHPSEDLSHLPQPASAVPGSGIHCNPGVTPGGVRFQRPIP